MCMENVNISTAFFESDLSEINGAVQFGKRIDKVVYPADSLNGGAKICSLTIATFASAISSSKDEQLENEYEIMWMLEPQGGKHDDRIRLATSIFDVKKNKTDKRFVDVCRSFTNQTFKFTIRDLSLPCGDGVYFLKVFLRRRGNTEEWQIQSINSIEVKQSDCI